MQYYLKKIVWTDNEQYIHKFYRLSTLKSMKCWVPLPRNSPLKSRWPLQSASWVNSIVGRKKQKENKILNLGLHRLNLHWLSQKERKERCRTKQKQENKTEARGERGKERLSDRMKENLTKRGERWWRNDRKRSELRWEMRKSDNEKERDRKRKDQEWVLNYMKNARIRYMRCHVKLVIIKLKNNWRRNYN